MINYKEFISNEKSMLIAPAGFGKTYTIAECLKYLTNQGKQLILTHTHAGISSIKEKITKEGISSSCYTVETISSFAQRYVLSFYTGIDLPAQEDSKSYYPFIIEKAVELFKLKPIKQVISNSYNGLFVDEYQDCTEKQHELILTLSSMFKTRILGDHMQGIFGFKEPLVNMENSNIMMGFAVSKYELDKPQRWLNGNNANLGNDLKLIRECLINKEIVDLTKYRSIEFHICHDIFNEKKIFELLYKEDSFLIIDPLSERKDLRITFIQRFSNIPRLIESIDDKDFYKLSRDADLITKVNIIPKLIDMCIKLFNKTGVDTWFNNKGLKNKRDEIDKKKQQILDKIIKSLQNKVSFSILSKLLILIEKLPEIKCYRKELFKMFCLALEDAECNSVSVFEAMTNKRNAVRRVGRKIFGKCIGTTLLTKGLEFDTVAIINAHMFKCPKHLYVAMTRASKRLIIFTENSKLNPYK